jgi:hypothetical protein
MRRLATRLWTPERDELLLIMRRDGHKFEPILDALNQLAGLPLPGIKSLENRCYTLRHSIKHPLAVQPHSRVLPGRADTGFGAACTSQAPEPRREASLNLPAGAQTPAGFLDGDDGGVVSYEYACAWAARHGLWRRGQGLNLIGVNKYRAALRLTAFTISQD